MDARFGKHYLGIEKGPLASTAVAGVTKLADFSGRGTCYVG